MLWLKRISSEHFLCNMKSFIIEERKRKTVQKNILDVITEYSINEGIDKILLRNEEYLKIQNKIAVLERQFDDLNLTKEHRLIIDRLISAHTESGAVYGKMTYGKGVQDCAALLLEMGLLKEVKAA